MKILLIIASKNSDSEEHTKNIFDQAEDLSGLPVQLCDIMHQNANSFGINRRKK
jgi:hypothetical protein